MIRRISVTSVITNRRIGVVVGASHVFSVIRSIKFCKKKKKNLELLNATQASNISWFLRRLRALFIDLKNNYQKVKTLCSLSDRGSASKQICIPCEEQNHWCNRWQKPKSKRRKELIKIKKPNLAVDASCRKLDCFAKSFARQNWNGLKFANQAKSVIYQKTLQTNVRHDGCVSESF